ncbi:hypothetical protein [cf. Phormidesmis sp. LEGE 11477]|uniref:hypothetical protein n=1 Tax=cf. Phormidesmis sp. LEGE 11477 TaxID=1828680 RepID=UPI001881957D|nr:hypothetical protein [cf. Phormidesmis sp. LEGE 11477]MBE9061125.1 hypothetical protein [cf. Phormidesmis sp. LEGE 11477]
MEPRADIPERIVQNIAKSLDHSVNMTRAITRLNSVLFMTSIVSAASTTLITTLAAARGPVIGAGTQGWQLSCGIAAFFGFVTTLAEGFKHQSNDKMTRSRLCIERLRLLDISLRHSQRPVEEIDREFDEIVRAYPEAMN